MWEAIDTFTQVFRDNDGKIVAARTTRRNLDQASDDVADFVGEHVSIAWECGPEAKMSVHGKVQLSSEVE